MKRDLERENRKKRRDWHARDVPKNSMLWLACLGHEGESVSEKERQTENEEREG